MLEYAIIALGLFAFGDAAYVPAVYLAITGHLLLWPIMLMSFVASNLMDIGWYLFGTKGLQKVFKSLPFIAKWEEKHPELMASFFKHQLKIIFWSRFLHGMGYPIMILSGVYKVPFKKYMMMNLLSALIIVFSVPTVIYFTQQSSYAIFNSLKLAEIVLVVAVILIFALSRFKIRKVATKILLGKKDEKGL
ncbi:MAG: hypothetical protein AAB660_02650 [Patescibacteria group bacterium]